MSQPLATTAHAVLTDVGLSISAHDDITSLQYDDGSSTLLLLDTSNTLYAYSTHPLPPPPSPRSPSSPPGPTPTSLPPPSHLQWTLPLPEGPTPSLIRVNHDHTLVALQRSPILIEFLSLQTGNVFVHASHRGRSPILTYFFTDCPDAALVVITADALEASRYASNCSGFHLATRTPLPALRWWRYTHETRVAAAGLGPAGAHVLTFQFSPSGMLRLAPLDLRPPGPSRHPSPISKAEATIVKLYGRVYLAYLDRDAMRLELHRYYTDAALLEATYDIFSPHVALLVTDNILVAHHPDSAVALLLDVIANPSAPIANPLPLGLLTPPIDAPSQPPLPLSPTSAHMQPSSTAAPSPRSPPPPTPCRAPTVALMPPNPGKHHLPNIIMDHRSRTLYRAHLDLHAIARSCSDLPLLVAVLQRRRPSPAPPGQATPHALLLATVKAALQERVPTSTLRRVFDHLTIAVAAVTTAATARAADGPAAPLAEPPPVTILTPDEVSRHVFRWAHDEEVVDAPYLSAALTEYQISAQEAGVQLPPYLQLLAMDMLLQQGQSFQVGQALASHPQLGSLFAAEHLEDSAAAAAAAMASPAAAGYGSAAAGMPLGQLAQDIHARAALLLHGGAAGDRYCRRLLTEGLLLRAARVMRNWGLGGMPPHYMLEASGRKGDKGLMTAVYRHWARALADEYPRFEQARLKYLMGSGGEGDAEAGRMGSNGVSEIH